MTNLFFEQSLQQQNTQIAVLAWQTFEAPERKKHQETLSHWMVQHQKNACELMDLFEGQQEFFLLHAAAYQTQHVQCAAQKAMQSAQWEQRMSEVVRNYIAHNGSVPAGFYQYSEELALWLMEFLAVEIYQDESQHAILGPIIEDAILSHLFLDAASNTLNQPFIGKVLNLFGKCIDKEWELAGVYIGHTLIQHGLEGGFAFGHQLQNIYPCNFTSDDLECLVRSGLRNLTGQIAIAQPDLLSFGQPIHLAVYHQQFEMAKDLIQIYQYHEKFYPIDELANTAVMIPQATALGYALGSLSLPLVKLVVEEAGADVTKPTVSGRIPIRQLKEMLWSTQEHKKRRDEIIEYLLQKGSPEWP